MGVFRCTGCGAPVKGGQEINWDLVDVMGIPRWEAHLYDWEEFYERCRKMDEHRDDSDDPVLHIVGVRRFDDPLPPDDRSIPLSFPPDIPSVAPTAEPPAPAVSNYKPKKPVFNWWWRTMFDISKALAMLIAFFGAIIYLVFDYNALWSFFKAFFWFL